MKKQSTFLRWSVYLVLTTILLSVILSPLNVRAQQDDFSEIDVVLLVDQSLSIRQSDPDSIRHEAARFAWQWAQQLLSEYDHDEAKLSINLGIIFFGTSPEVVLPLQPVGKLASADLEYLNLTMEQLGERASVFTDARFTEYRPALEAALAMLEAMQGEAGVQRLQRLVLISDGIPDTQRVAQTAGNTTDLSAAYATALRDAFEGVAPQNVYLMRVPATPEQTWRQVEAVWQEVIGASHVLVVSNMQTMGSELQQILGVIIEELGILPDDRLACGPFDMPAYIDTAYFTVHKPTSSTRVHLQDPLGRDVIQVDWKASVNNAVAQASVTSNSEGFIESIAVFNPVPGSWELLCPIDFAGDVPVYWRTTWMRGHVQVEPTYAGIPSQISYQLLAHNGSPLLSYETNTDPLDVRATVTSGDHLIQTMLLREFDSNRYQAMVTFPETATVQLQVSLPSMGRVIEPLESLSNSIALQPIFYRWQQQEELAQFASSSITLELVNQQGEPLYIPASIGERLELRLTADNDIDTILAPLVQDDQLLFRGSVVFRFSGTRNLVVDLVNLEQKGQITTLEPWNGNNEFDVFPPTLIKSNDERIPIFVPTQIELTPVNRNNERLPSDALNYAAIPVRRSSSNTVLAWPAARWIPERDVYRLWILPFAWDQDVFLHVRWGLSNGTRQVTEPIEISLPTTNPFESFQEYYIIPSFVALAVLLLLIVGIWTLRHRPECVNKSETRKAKELVSIKGRKAGREALVDVHNHFVRWQRG